jgi:hypothetical protein
MARIIRVDCKTQSFFPWTVTTSMQPVVDDRHLLFGTSANKDRHGVSDGALRVIEQLQALQKALGKTKTSIADAGS